MNFRVFRGREFGVVRVFRGREFGVVRVFRGACSIAV